MSDVASSGGDTSAAYRQDKVTRLRKFAPLVWLYLLLLAVSTVTLGVFVVAFVASLKDDALLDPTELSIEQLKPANWISAWRLGRDGGGGPWLGGLQPGGKVELYLSYANTSDELLVPPIVTVPKPRRALGAGGADAVVSDLVRVSEPVLVTASSDVSYQEISGTRVTPRVGVSRTWRVDILHEGTGHGFEKLPVTALVPKGQVLLDSTLPPSRTERRGRVSSWNNLVPGAIGYVFSNYVRVIKDSTSLENGRSLFLTWTFNSFFIAILKVSLTLVIACMGGYVLARFTFPGSRIIFFVLLLSMMVPAQVLFVSNYLVFREIGLLNTPWAVITAVVASAQVLIMKQFFESIPREVEEAAIVDGASPIAILTKIFLPMSKPAIATVTILGFQGAWNDFFWPLVVLTSPSEAYTLPVGLLSLRNAYGIAGDWSLILAGSFLSVVPVLLVFIFFQRYFVDNDSSAAVKG